MGNIQLLICHSRTSLGLKEGTNQIYSIVDYKIIVPITIIDGGRNTYTTTKADTTEKHLGCEVVAVIYGNF